MNGIGYRKDIDGLRSLAILPVMFNHSDLSIAPGGFVGVDIFFVISGFLITGVLVRDIDNDRFSIVSFYERRIRRIVPALVVLLIACLAVGWLILLPGEYEDLSKSTFAVLLFSSNIWFWREAGDYFAEAVTTAPLLHTWSLAVEEQFYLFFPLLLLLLAKRSYRTRIWVIGLISIASFILSLALTNLHPTANFYLLPTRIWELGLGALIAIGVVPASKSSIVNDTISVTGITAIVLSVALINEKMPFPGLTAVPPCLGAAAILWSGQRGDTMGGKLLSSSLLVWFGLISYSLYLWHWPVFVTARIISGNSLLGLPMALFCIVLSVILGWLSWRFIERPFRNTQHGIWIPRARIFKTATLAIGSIMLVCGLVLVSGGASRRIPDTVNALLLEAKYRTELENRCMSIEIGDPPCLIGPATKNLSFVVWGDSHAGAMLSGFESVLSDTDQSAVAFTKSACPPLPQLWRVDQGIRHHCDLHNADVLRQINSDFPNSTIILVARWALATQSVRAEGEAGANAVFARSGEQPRTSEENAALVHESLDRLVSHLHADGHKVIIFAGIPEQGKDINKLVARSALLGGDGQEHIKGWTTRDSYNQRNSKAMPIFQHVSKQYGSQIINVRDIMCTQVCAVSENGKLLYRDDNHLSNFGAHLLIAQAFSVFQN